MSNQDTAVERAQRYLTAERGAVRRAQADAFSARRVISGPTGATHVRFDRTHNGLPVLGGDVVVHHGPNGVAREPSVTLKRPLSINVKPSVSQATAVETAEKRAQGRATQQPRLVVDAMSDPAELAWEVVVHQPDDYKTVLVDAHRGTIRRQIGGIQHGTGTGVENGSVSIGTNLVSGSYQMIDPAHGDMKVCDLNNGPSTGACPVFTDADDVWGDGTMANDQSAAVDISYGAAMTYDYYLSALGRNGIYGDGKGVTLKAHLGNGYFNAGWSPSSQTASFGDGSGNNDPLVELDIVGHELSHGLTQQLANLFYAAESGGLNEATSDIFGSMVEFYANNPNDPPDYKLGEKLSHFGPGKALRYMYDPKLDAGNFPTTSVNCWDASVASLDPHFSSGVGNHFFFLLAEGSGQTFYGDSPTCNGSTVIGIGRDKAAQLWYHALDAYYTTNETYHDARDHTLAAASDLFGWCSTEYMTVRAAWAAVGVGEHSSPCVDLRKYLYWVELCWLCPPIPDPGPYKDIIIIDAFTQGNTRIEVGVDIYHPNKGDIQIDLIAPNGREYRLKTADPGERGADINAVFDVELGSPVQRGSWELRVTDTVRGNAGYLEGWTMLV